MNKQKFTKLVFTSFLGLVFMLSSFITPIVAATTFTDLERVQSWAGESIDYLVHKGVINGVGNNKFNPSGELTRGEAAKILALTLGLDVDMNEGSNFGDAKNHWASPYIHALQSQSPGVINGFPNGTFQPNEFITREQMAKMMVTAYALLENEDHPYTIQFHDVSGWATDYVQILASHGIIEGKSQKRFAPKDPVNRAEAAAFVHRAEVAYYLTPLEITETVSVEQNGVTFEVGLQQSNGLLFANVKVTNISEEAIPYIGSSGCDTGISVNVYDEKGIVGMPMHNPLIACTMMIVQYFLDPGETIETYEVIIAPAKGFQKDHFVKIQLKNGLLDETYLDHPIEIEIPLNGK